MYRHDWRGVPTWQCLWWRPIAYQTPVTSFFFFFFFLPPHQREHLAHQAPVTSSFSEFFHQREHFWLMESLVTVTIRWMPLAFLGMMISHSLSLYRTAVYVRLFSSQCLGSAKISVDVGTYLDAAACCKPNFKQQSELSNFFTLLRIANYKYCSSHEVVQMTWSNEKIVSLTSFSFAHFSPLNRVTNIMVREWE